MCVCNKCGVGAVVFVCKYLLIWCIDEKIVVIVFCFGGIVFFFK